MYAPIRKYEYNTSGQVISVAYCDNAGTPAGVYNYNWQGGDVYGNPRTFTYYDTSFQYASWQQFGEFLELGRPLFPCKHLQKSWYEPSIWWGRTYMYTFDADGKVASATEVEGNTVQGWIVFRYECF